MASPVKSHGKLTLGRDDQDPVKQPVLESHLSAGSEKYIGESVNGNDGTAKGSPSYFALFVEQVLQSGQSLLNPLNENKRMEKVCPCRAGKHEYTGVCSNDQNVASERLKEASAYGKQDQISMPSSKATEEFISANSKMRRETLSDVRNVRKRPEKVPGQGDFRRPALEQIEELFTKVEGQRKYSFCYPGGIWTEVPLVAETKKPREIFFWRIEGPEVYDSETASESDEEATMQPIRATRRVKATSDVTRFEENMLAEPGWPSPLQKSHFQMVGPLWYDERFLGRPGGWMSRSACRVTAAIGACDDHVTYVEEPNLSDEEDVVVLDDSLLDDEVESGSSVSLCSVSDEVYAKKEDTINQDLLENEEGYFSENTDFDYEVSKVEWEDEVENEKIETKEQQGEEARIKVNVVSSNGATLNSAEANSRDGTVAPCLEYEGTMRSMDERTWEKGTGDVGDTDVEELRGRLEFLKKKAEQESERANVAEKENNRLLNVVFMLKSELENEQAMCNGEVAAEVEETRRQLREERRLRMELEDETRAGRGEKRTKKKGKGWFGLGRS